MRFALLLSLLVACGPAEEEEDPTLITPGGFPDAAPEAEALPRGAAPDAARGEPAPEAEAPEAPSAEGHAPDTVQPAPPRLVAMGDLHGDYDSMIDGLQLAGLIDETGEWIGGKTVLVQVGDQLDRGDGERRILHYLEDLAEAAAEVGGAVYPLLGNHETMNVRLDLRYVTTGGFAEFADLAPFVTDELLRQYPRAEQGRVAAFRPGGPYARLLAGHNVVMVVGETVFVHGGVLPSMARYGLDRVNAEVQSWFRGERVRPDYLSGEDSPVWSRHYSSETTAADCALLLEALEAIPAERMVVAHTVQDEGINAACEGRVWRVDVGLSDYYGGRTAILEIVGEQVTPIRALFD